VLLGCFPAVTLKPTRRVMTTVPPAPVAPVTALVELTGGALLVTAEELVVRVWDVYTASVIAAVELTGADDGFPTAAIAMPHGIVVLATKRHTDRCFTRYLVTDSLEAIRPQWNRRPFMASAMAALPDGAHYVSGRRDGTLDVHAVCTRATDYDDPVAVMTDRHAEAVNAVLSFGAHSLATASDDGTVCVWDTRTHSRSFSQDARSNAYSVVQVSSDHLATSHYDGVIRVWDLRARTCVLELEGHVGAVGPLVLLPTSHLVSLGHDDHTLRLWEVQGGGRCAAVMRLPAQPRCALLLRSGNLLMVGCDDGVVYGITLGLARRWLALVAWLCACGAGGDAGSAE